MTEKELLRLTKLREIEEKIYLEGKNYICGIDEAGRGPLAGPVVVASCIMPKDSMIDGVNDSKKISEKKRERVFEEIIKEAVSYGVGIIDESQIDEINILQATKLRTYNFYKRIKNKTRNHISRCFKRYKHTRYSIYVYNKRRCIKLFNSISIHYCKSYKRQNNAWI